MCNGFVVIILRFSGYIVIMVPVTDIFHRSVSVTTAVKNIIV